MENQQSLFLSVIIPSYREGERIGRTLLEIDAFCKAKPWEYEILVVVDGSPDNTAEVARNYARQVSNLRVIENSENHGKGYVVRQGLLEARGKYRLFMDADGSTSINHLESFLPQFEQDGYDVVIGSRDIKGANVEVHQPFYRELLGNMGNLAIQSILGLWGYPDTQCGFKMLSDVAAQEIASRMVVDRFAFDFELIVLAKKLGFKIKQMPVRWLDEAEGTTVKLFGPNGYFQVLRDLFMTRIRLNTGQYHIGVYTKK
jgi:dolichyl-phosphate beta-glucosyltransferase